MPVMIIISINILEKSSQATKKSWSWRILEVLVVVVVKYY